MRFDTTNIRRDAKMYSVVGTTAVGADELVQVGMVGGIGSQIEDNVYEFLPLATGATEAFFIATPEVDYDEYDISKNTLKGFRLSLGQVTDAVKLEKHDKFAIEESASAIVGLVDGVATVGGYLYAKVGERLLQYKATLPVTEDNAVIVAEIELKTPATQGIAVKAVSGAFQSLQMSYNLLRCRIL